eukprot:599995_1
MITRIFWISAVILSSVTSTNASDTSGTLKVKEFRSSELKNKPATTEVKEQWTTTGYPVIAENVLNERIIAGQFKYKTRENFLLEGHSSLPQERSNITRPRSHNISPTYSNHPTVVPQTAKLALMSSPRKSHQYMYNPDFHNIENHGGLTQQRYNTRPAYVYTRPVINPYDAALAQCANMQSPTTISNNHPTPETRTHRNMATSQDIPFDPGYFDYYLYNIPRNYCSVYQPQQHHAYNWNTDQTRPRQSSNIDQNVPNTQTDTQNSDVP